ncbi:MAG: prepilin-type N-terminal cleavage/methylation domain-containing protein, partial [Planctomycetes bacterium]|nr:prepilin-type N-terminal cleavage/methylation domain-containing protein [Planctomycetota bacterium]
MANKTNKTNNNVATAGVSFRRRRAFSFIEMITVLTISSLIIMSVIMICSRTKRAAASINRKLDSKVLPKEILQRIAEDLDRLAAPGFNVAVTIENKLS